MSAHAPGYLTGGKHYFHSTWEQACFLSSGKVLTYLLRLLSANTNLRNELIADQEYINTLNN